MHPLHWNWWSLYWLVWFVVLFGVPEGIALATGHPENTLSDQVWHLEGYQGRQTLFQNPIHWSTLHWLIFIGMVWLFGHFIDHIWR